MQQGGNTPSSGYERRRRSERNAQPVMRPVLMPDQPMQRPQAQSAQRQQSYYASQPQNGYQAAPSQTQWPQPPMNYASSRQQGYIQQPQTPVQQAAPAWQNPTPYQEYQQPYQPPVDPRYQGGNGGGSNLPPKKKDGLLKSLLCWAVILIVVAAGIAVAMNMGQQAMQQQQAENYVTSFDDRFIHGVYVDGIHLGGMTREEGIAAVTAQAQQRNDSWAVRLMYAGQVVTEIRASHLGMSTNVTDAIAAAWEKGHTGTMEERLVAMEKMLTEPFYAYSAAPAGDNSRIDDTLDQIAKLVYRTPQDAALVAFDPELSYPFTIQPEVMGRYLDTTALKERIYQMVSSMESGDLEIVPTELYPTVTAEQIRQSLSVRADFYTKISTTSTEERTNNIVRSFELISGTALTPGQEFSFNKIVGARSTENGFFPAIEYAYNEETIGVGGGVCQASSTIYIAAVQAGLEITDREPHSMEVNYTEYGKDATVNIDGKKIDFKFKNNTDAPIYIVARVMSDPDNRKRSVARVTIYGQSLGEKVSYDLVTETLEILPVPINPTYKADKDGEHGLTYKDEEKVTFKGQEGCVVQSYRVKYVNGEEVERVPLYRDVYKARPVIIYRGTKNR